MEAAGLGPFVWLPPNARAACLRPHAPSSGCTMAPSPSAQPSCGCQPCALQGSGKHRLLQGALLVPRQGQGSVAPALAMLLTSAPRAGTTSVLITAGSPVPGVSVRFSAPSGGGRRTEGGQAAGMDVSSPGCEHPVPAGRGPGLAGAVARAAKADEGWARGRGQGRLRRTPSSGSWQEGAEGECHRKRSGLAGS